MNKETMAYVIAFTFTVTFVMATVLSAAHSTTISLVERHELERRKSTVLAAIGVAAESTEEVFENYAALEQLAEGGSGLYMHDASGTPVVARQFSGPGVWGDIVGVVSVNADATRVIGVEILDQNETPGLGGRVTDRRFLDQLRGERIGPDGIYVVVRGPGDADKDNAQIDGITGATGTTRAFDRMLNQELRALRELLSANDDGRSS